MNERSRVIPAYMGLIKQIDDQIGVLMKFLDDQGLTDSTMIVFTSDHGDYLGDHWLGEKDLFHDCSAKIPLIVADPTRPGTHGSRCEALVEAIDLAPTFLEFFGGIVAPNIMEGRSLLPWLDGQSPAWRQHVFSEYDYSMQEARLTLGQKIEDCRLFMVFDGRFKLIHAVGFAPMLYDLQVDPNEFIDLGGDATHADIIARLQRALMDWALRDHNRITQSDARIAAYGNGQQLRQGIVIGVWDAAELKELRMKAGL